jgi:hypothetical protein
MSELLSFLWANFRCVNVHADGSVLNICTMHRHACGRTSYVQACVQTGEFPTCAPFVHMRLYGFLTSSFGSRRFDKHAGSCTALQTRSVVMQRLTCFLETSFHGRRGPVFQILYAFDLESCCRLRGVGPFPLQPRRLSRVESHL